MKRFLTAEGAVANAIGLIAVLVTAFGVHAQDGKTYRIGVLSLGGQPVVLRERLNELGYVEGRNLTLEIRSAAGEHGLLKRYADDLVSLKVDLILASATPSAQAAQRATSTIPIVFFAVVDPVGAGLVPSLARPGSNLTGISLLSGELAGKRFELLREIAPKLATVGVLLNRLNESNGIQLAEIESAASGLGVKLRLLEVRSAQDIDRVLHGKSTDGLDALIALDDPLIVRERKRVAEWAQLRRLPTMSGFPIAAEAGFLVAYGPQFEEQLRTAAEYAHRILNGARPADMPVEQPKRFTLILNLSTARQIGLAIPGTVLFRADRIID